MNRLTIVEHNNIALVAPEIADQDILAEWMHDPATNTFLDQNDFEWWVCPRLMQLKTFEGQLSKHGHLMVIYLKDTNEIAGTITLHSLNEYHRYATPGIRIFSKYHSQGIGTQAMRLLLKYAFELQGFHKVNLYVWAENTGAIECYKRCWFQQIGYHREHYWRFDRYHDVMDMEILVDEYKRLKDEWFV